MSLASNSYRSSSSSLNDHSTSNLSSIVTNPGSEGTNTVSPTGSSTRYGNSPMTPAGRTRHNGPIIINIMYKSKRYNSITIPSSGLTESKLFALLNIPPWIHRNLELLSLKRLPDSNNEQDYVSDTESGSSISMDSYRGSEASKQQSDSIPFEILPHTNNQIRAITKVHLLSHAATYQLILNDHSVNYVDLISEEDKAAIKQKFAAMDRDSNGNISMAEIQAYYQNITDRKMEALKEKMDQVAVRNRRKRSSMDHMWQEAVANLERMQSFAVRQFMQRDRDGDDSIDMSEFMEAEARILMISRQNEPSTTNTDR